MPFLWVGTFLMIAVLGGANLWFGELNQDEGWYLYAARLVAEGGIPYRDFSYTQGPMLPFVYVLSLPFQSLWGMAGGRLFTLLLALLGLTLAGMLATRMTGDRRAALVVWMVGGINVYQLYFTTIVKTYALSSVFLAGGYLVLWMALSRRSFPGVMVAGFVLALAVGVRLSCIAVLPVVFGYLLWLTRRGDGPSSLPWALVAGSALGGFVVFAPLAWMAPESFWFHLVEYHSTRTAGGWLPGAVYKAGFISRVVQAYFVPLCVALGLLLLWTVSPRRAFRVDSSLPGFAPMIGWSLLAVTLLHLSAPFPYDDYQAPLLPLAAAALSVGLMRWLSWVSSGDAKSPHAAAIMGLLFSLSVASAWSSPINQSWMIAGRDRLWWQMKPEPAMAQLKQAAAKIHALGPGHRLLTQDIYLAIETGLEVPHGLTMGPFSLYPDWDEQRARTMGVMNADMMASLIDTTDIPVAAMSDYSLAVHSPEIVPLDPSLRDDLTARLAARYELVEEIPGFGQAGTTLRLYRLRETGGERR